MLRPVRITLEFVAAFAGILLVLALILVWRLSTHPLTSTVLTPYIAAAVAHVLPETHVHIEHTLLSWDNVDYAVSLHADGIEIKDKDDTTIAEVPSVDARLTMFGVLIGQFIPRTLIISHPQIRMEHGADGRLYFGGLSTKPGGKSDMQGGMRNLLREISGAHFLRKLQVSDTVVDVYDPNGTKQWSVHIPDVSLERINGILGGHIDVSLSQKDKVSTLELHYIYNNEKKLHELATHIENITPSLLAGGHPEVVGLGQASMLDLPLSGDMTAAFDSKLALHAGSMKIHGEKGDLNVPDFWDQPRAVKSLDVTAAWDGEKQKLEPSTIAADFGGPKLDIRASGRKPLLVKHDLDFEFKVKLADWPMDQYAKLWPKPIISDSREWIAANMSKGAFDRAEATFKGDLMWGHLSDLEITEGQGTISASHALVKYMDGMPPVEDVSTDASFDLKQMSLQITGGGIGDLRLMPFTIKMSSLDGDPQYIDIPLAMSGPITDVLKLIDQPPLQYAKAAGLSPGDVTGNAQGQVNLHFPLLKTLTMKDVDIGAAMKLTDTASSKLVDGVTITQGALDLALDKKGFTVKGPASFNGVPLQLAWQQTFNPEPGQVVKRANLTGIIKEEQWKTLGIDALNGSRGQTSVALQMSQGDDKKTSLSGQFDMGAAEIHIDQLNWKKPAAVPATFKFSAEMPEGKDTAVKLIEFTGPQVNIKGKGSFGADGALKSLSLSPLVIGRTNGALTVTQSNGTLRFDAKGPGLDVSGLRGGKDPGHAKPQPKEYHVKTDKLYTSDVGFITGAEGFAIRDAEGWSAISLHGMADGDHKLSIDLTPQPNGTRTFAISCDDFGKALKGMGFTDTVRDGNVNITGASTLARPRVIEGTAKISHFDVKGLPVLMLLLNATSPLGFTDILSNQTSFDRLKGKFRWQGDTIELIEVNAAGSSVGMNIDGSVNMDSGDAKLYGTIVPFSMFNRIIGAIPVLGDIITGGNGGGVLAVAYNIDGTLVDPKINVNPVSLLTPGFLRNIFFGGSDDDDKAAAEAPKESSQNPTSSPAAPSNGGK